MRAAGFGVVSWLVCQAVLFEPCLGHAFADADREGRDASTVIVTVNGQPITEGDLSLMMLSRRVPAELQPQVRKKFLDQLIDKRLLQQFLTRRKVRPSPLLLDAQVQTILDLIRRKCDDPEAVLQRLGYTVESLRQELALPLAWKAYVRLAVTSDRLRQYWHEHRFEFDGTEVRAAHILLKAKTDPEAADAEARLRRIRQDIVDGTISFADAARRYSQAPSRDQGGDLGYFPYRGRMPIEFSRVAFKLKVGEVSEPFRSRFGVHLLTVTDRRPGQLSLEDVREEVLERIGEQLRRDLLQRLRSRARIRWKTRRD
ncbi:MAG TPA: hypothetical protein EYP14_07470 [Planctomycetaceae bacterium]|nr:hypothetical protein [Planctomycetaceae bacterium]